MNRKTKQTPQPAPSEAKPERIVCGCKRGQASARDGMCSRCRGGSYLDVQRANDPLRNLGFNSCEVPSGNKS